MDAFQRLLGVFAVLEIAPRQSHEWEDAYWIDMIVGHRTLHVLFDNRVCDFMVKGGSKIVGRTLEGAGL